MSETERTLWDQLCQFAENSRLKHKVPGIVLGILHQGETFTKGFGVTNLEHPLEVTPQTLFQIGSITKTFTGTLIMKLVEEGKIDLETPVQTYLPDFKVADEETSATVTIQHLLTHTSDWFGDFFSDTGPGEDAAAKYVAKMATLEQLAPLGQVFSYNNAGFYLLGHLIEVITGKSYQSALREMFLEPMALENTFFDPGDVITHRFATGHNGVQIARPWPLPRAAYPVGGITCSVCDLLTYATFQMRNGELPNGKPFIHKDSLTQMQTPLATVWKQEQWGLSWGINDSYKTRLVSHGGATTGQTAQLMLAPEHQFAIAVFTNSGDGGGMILEVVRQALKEYLDITMTDSEPLEASEDLLASYVGKYTRPYADIYLGLLGGRLVGQIIYKMGFPAEDSPPSPAPPPFTLGLIEEDRLMVLDGLRKSAKLEIIRQSDGSIGWLRAGRIHQRVA